MRIGFIGTGNIGTPMAGSILKAGYELVVHDIHEEKTREGWLTKGQDGRNLRRRLPPSAT